jgi:hypothetical protein
VNGGDIYILRFGASAAENVKNLAFVDLIFKVAQPPHKNDEDEVADDDEDQVAGHSA